MRFLLNEIQQPEKLWCRIGLINELALGKRTMFHRTPNWIAISSEDFKVWESKFLLKNLEKPKAKRMHKWNWHKMPDFIKCYRAMPNGMVQVPLGIEGYTQNITRSGMDKLVACPFPEFTSITPYPYQTEAVDQLLQKPVGLLHATTGSGKTIMAMLIAQRLSLKTLVVVKDLTLLKQFVTDIQEKLGITPMYYGGTISKAYKETINTNIITVTSIQSVDKVPDLQSFWLVILDEVHTMLGSDIRRNWVGSLTNPYVYGLTGTPIINDVDPRVFNVYLWPTTKCEVINMTPDYKQVITSFEYDLDDISEFHKLKAALYDDEERNDKIVTTVHRTIGTHKGLVFTDYVEHAKLLKEKLTALGIETHLLIGEVPSDERKRITEYVKNTPGPQVIIGSVQVVGTGFDLSELSRAYLTTTTRFKWDLLQYCGRIIRRHPTKPHPVFYDFADIHQSLLGSQSKSRAQEYKRAFPTWKFSIDI